MTIRLWALALAGAVSCVAAPGAARSRDVLVAPGVSIHVLDEGRGEGSRPALVLVSGWRLPATIWSSQIARFGRERRVIAIDSRSQGGSSKVADGNTPERRAEDLREVLRQLRVRRPVLVGWSQGVQDVAAYVNRYGTQDVAGLVLVDSTISRGASYAQSAPEAAVRTLETVRTYTEHPRELNRGMLSAIISKPITPGERERLVEQMLRTPTAIGASMLVADLLGTDRSGAIGKFDRPTLIIASARSSELSEQRAMATSIAGSQFEVVQNAAHTVFVDQPEIFNDLLERFLRESIGPER